MALLPVKCALEKAYKSQNSDYDFDCTKIRRMNGGLIKMEECYINLGIVEENGYEKQTQIPAPKKFFESIYIRPRSSEELNVDTANPIELKNLFGKRGEKGCLPPKRILIYGKAGIGKTTLCRKLVHSFYTENVWKDKFDCVVWIPLRKLKGFTKTEDGKIIPMEQIYEKLFFKNDPAMAKALLNHGKESHVLFILDGWDEISELLSEDTFMAPIIEYLTSMPFLIVTSRPHAPELWSLEVDEKLETIGFNQDDIWKYINVVFETKRKQAEIIKFIERHAVVSALATIPVQLDLLCDLLPRGFESLKSEQMTMTTLYKILMFKLWTLFLKNGGHAERELVHLNVLRGEVLANYKNVQDANALLSKMAYDGILENRLEFDCDDFSDAGNKEQMSHVLVGQVKTSHFLYCLTPLEDESNRKYSFLHLTFQEFMAAVHIAKHLPEDDMVTLINKHKYNPRFQIVWPFVAGLIAGDWPIQSPPMSINSFFNFMESSPIEVIGNSHYNLIINCLGECNEILSEVNPRCKERLENYLQLHIKSSNAMGLLHDQLPSNLVEDILSGILPSSSELQKWQVEPQNRLERDHIGNILDELKTLKWLPDSTLLNLFNAISGNSDNSSKIVHFLRDYPDKNRHLGDQGIKDITKRLEDFVKEVKEGNKYKTEIMHSCIRLVRQRIPPKGTLKVLKDLFDSPISTTNRIAIADVFSHCEESLQLDFVDHANKNYIQSSMQEIGLKCIRWFENLSFDIQNEIADLLLSNSEMSQKLIIDTLLSQRQKSPEAEMKILEFFSSKSKTVPEKLNIIAFLSRHKFLNEGLTKLLMKYLNRLLPIISQNKNSPSFGKILSILHFKELPNPVEETLLGILKDDEKYPREIVKDICDVFQTCKSSARIVKEVTELCIESLDRDSGYYEEYLTLLEDEEMTPRLISAIYAKFKQFYAENKIIEAHRLLKYLGNQKIVFEDENMIKDFLYILIDLLKHPKEIDEYAYLHAIKILSSNPQYFLFQPIKEEIILILGEQLETLNAGQGTSFYAKNLFSALQNCKNLDSTMLMEVVQLFLQFPLKKTEEIDRMDILKNPLNALRGLLKNKSNILKTLKLLLSKENWKDTDNYFEHAHDVLLSCPLLAVLKSIEGNSCDAEIFTKVILPRIYFRKPQPNEIAMYMNAKNTIILYFGSGEEKTLSLYETAGTNELITYSTEEMFSRSPIYDQEYDPLTRFLQFHNGSECLEYIRQIEPKAMKNEIEEYSDLEVMREQSIGYLKLHLKSGDIDGIENLCKEMSKQFQKESQIEIRHLDLSQNHLNDEKVEEIIIFMKKLECKLRTLILCDNEIVGTCLNKIISLCKILNVKYLFLNENHIHLESKDFDNYLNDQALQQPPIDILKETQWRKYCKEESYLNRTRSLERVELADNFIQYLKFQDNDQKDYLKHSIDQSKILISSVTKTQSFSPLWLQFTSDSKFQCSPLEKEEDTKVTTEFGCVIVAERKTKSVFQIRGHQFMIIDWLPENNCGQRQLLLSDLVTNNTKSPNRFKIRIFQIAPNELFQKIAASRSSFRSISLSNPDIKRLIHFLNDSHRKEDVFDYSLIPSIWGKNNGAFNCITWTDKALKEVLPNIEINSMRREERILKVLAVILPIFISILIISMFT